MEDLVEELVGEIWDETDPDLTTVHREEDGTVVVPGRYPIHDLPDIGIELPTGNYATVAGFVLDTLGTFPEVGATLERDGVLLEVRAIERHAISSVAVTPAPDTDEFDG